MPLSEKPAQWADEAAASLDVLMQEGSVTVARHHLSTAVSRKPQKFLWAAAKGHAEILANSDNGAAILTCLAEFGTPTTVGELCEELCTFVKTVDSEATAKLLAALAVRIDDTKGKRVELFTKLTRGLSAKAIVEHPLLRRAIAPLVGDQQLGAAVVKAATDKAAVAWLAASICAKKADPAAVDFIEVILKQSAAVPDFALSLTKAVVTALKSSLEAKAEHRPRPEVMKALVANGNSDALDALAAAMSAWANLGPYVATGESKAVATLISRVTPTLPGRAKLVKAIVAAVPIERLATQSFGTGALALAIRDSGLIDLTGLAVLDAVEDKIACTTSNCAKATELAIKRELARSNTKLVGTGADGSGRRHPAVKVVESDDDEAVAPAAAPAKKAHRAEAASAPRKAVAARAAAKR